MPPQDDDPGPLSIQSQDSEQEPAEFPATDRPTMDPPDSKNISRTALFRQNLVTVLGGIGCLLWFGLFFIKTTNPAAPITYRDLAILGAAVAGLLQVDLGIGLFKERNL